jgi:hypothetical protein
VCKLDGKCGFKGKGKGLKNEECEHVTDCVQGMNIFIQTANVFVIMIDFEGNFVLLTLGFLE